MLQSLGGGRVVLFKQSFKLELMIASLGTSPEISVEDDIDILDYSINYKFIPTIFSIKLHFFILAMIS